MPGNSKKTPRRRLRLDEQVVAAGLAASIDEAQRLIMAGLVRSGDRVWDKAGMLIPTDVVLALKERPCPFVSRGGLKLSLGLDAFAIDVTGLRCLDIGASTGGFTDVLLQRGAAHVTALDVGKGLLAHRLVTDSRVRVLDKTNFRLLPENFFPAPFDLVVVDVSFISLRLILPKARAMLVVPVSAEDDGIPAPVLNAKESENPRNNTGIVNNGNRSVNLVMPPSKGGKGVNGFREGCVLALIKPQFEAPRELVSPGGLVHDRQVHAQVIMSLRDDLLPSGLLLLGVCPVQPGGAKKNREFISLWGHSGVLLSDIAVQQSVQS